MSLRPLAAAIGTSARMLVYHFGSKEGLVAALLERVATDWMAALGGLLERDPSPGTALATFWAETLRKPAHRPLHALAFEAWALGLASGDKRYRPFLDLVASGWIGLLERALLRDPRTRRRARARATLLVAATEGLLLHQLTDQRLAVDAAFDELVSWLRAVSVDGARS
jgi:AcrR family transcriptional regulator